MSGEHDHVHAPCVKNPAMVHLLHSKGFLDDGGFETLHGSEGCGDCPNASTIGRCSVLNALNVVDRGRLDGVINLVTSSPQEQS